MISVLSFFFRMFFSLFLSRKQLALKIAVLEKEKEILRRKIAGKRITTNRSDRIFFVVLNRIMAIKDRISIVQPDTVLRWQRTLIKHFWTFKEYGKKRGRKPVDKETEDLI